MGIDRRRKSNVGERVSLLLPLHAGATNASPNFLGNYRVCMCTDVVVVVLVVVYEDCVNSLVMYLLESNLHRP